MKNYEKFKRQISLWGLEHQKILMSNFICILGSNLITLEIAKGLLLSGVSNLTIVDNELANSDDSKYYIFCTNVVNNYRCKVIKNNLMNINENANIDCIVENPIQYFHNEILKNNNSYDIIVCNLSVKNNLMIEKLCIENNKNVVTCHSNGFLGYLNICIKNHLYMDNDKNDDFSYYYYLSISLNNELKEYVKNIEYSYFTNNTPSDKILFLVKCYQDFCNLKDKKKINFLEFIKKKNELTNLHFSMKKINILINLNEIILRINYFLKDKKLINKTHLFIFLVVYKSFIKKKKKLPYLFDFSFNDKNINNILKKRNISDKKEIKYIIDRKRKKYNFKKRFNISYFTYFFSNFHFIRKKENNKNENSIFNNFLDFLYLYIVSSYQKTHENNVHLLKNEKYFSDSSSEEKKCDSNNKILKRKSKILSCNKKNDILNFYKNPLVVNLKKKGNTKYQQEIRYKSFLSNKNEKSIVRLYSLIDINKSFLLQNIEKINNIFITYNKYSNINNNCVSLLLAGLITQEVLKICTLFLKPYLNYFFYKRYE
ncbi:ubiquitin-activating enzyme E1, putative [Plasmodium gallinaceum]|uniref:Ubiquitin-activating enzyme E1, putative n=1 Tax=Plasmodium gallinaceum TaxID=5849 RepID=A0A1J1GRS4_PLAGA|nr:ubiquitin-activating enzyme E1, putative [Plasmodium gallinaceum]CRG95210.1 ubiquitin-activating enzyme E1, putative [Plasmodium gallinaceum]